MATYIVHYSVAAKNEDGANAVTLNREAFVSADSPLDIEKKLKKSLEKGLELLSVSNVQESTTNVIY